MTSAPEGKLRAGDRHYRAYVGPPEDYDLIAAITCSLLFSIGLREHHRLMDLGCGSLRIGRVLIPYLGVGCYAGSDPNEWLVAAGIEQNLGMDLVELRKPTFLYRSDFDMTVPEGPFDVVLAQSIFSHTQSDLLKHALRRVAMALKGDGILVATYVHGEDDPESEGVGWLYPGCTRFSWPVIGSYLETVGLHGAEIDWPHPRQRWFIASPSAERVAHGSKLRRPLPNGA